MAVLVMDSFDWNGNTIINNRYFSVTGVPTFSNTYTKHGAGYSFFGNSADYLKYDIGAQGGNIIIIGFYVYVTTFPPSGIPSVVQALADTTVQCYLSINASSHKMQIQSSVGGILATGDQVLQLNTWYHIEWKIKVTNSTVSGECVVNIDGIEDINAVGIDTQSYAANTFDKVNIGASTSAVMYFDDFYILDTTGTYANAFIGPHVRIECLEPDGNGNSNDFVGSDADSVNNYLHVDEAPADDDTTYVEASVVNNKDSYTFDDIAGNASAIMAVQTMTRHKKDESGARTVKHFIRRSAVDYDGSVEHTLSNGTYENDIELWAADPSTSSQWTETGVNGAEAGIKIQS